jgi:hypothetical protein
MSRTRRDILDTESMLERLTKLLTEHEPPQGIVVGYDFNRTRRDAESLRRISMTLHRWHELECGTDAGAIERDQPWAIERAAWPAADRVRWWDDAKWVRKSDRRTYDDHDKARIMDGLPTTRQWNSADYAKANAQGFPSQGAWRATGCYPRWRYSDGRMGNTVPDREKGALARLAKIAKRYPSLAFYVQGDPRGCALYVLRAGDVPEGSTADSCYSRGLAVHQ